MIDHHTHLGKDTRTGFSLNVETISRRMDMYKIEKTIVFPCPNNYSKGKNPYKEENQQIIEYKSKDSRVIPFMFVNPILDEVHYLKNLSKEFAGFKLNPKVDGLRYSYSLIKDSTTLEFLLDSGKPILFHTGCREGTRIKDLALLTQKTSSPIIFAHSGDLIHEDLKAISQFPYIYIDISPLATMIKRHFFINQERRDLELKELSVDKILNYLIKLFGKDKIIWGSDSPWCDNLIPNGYEKEVKVMRRMIELGCTNTPLKGDKK